MTSTATPDRLQREIDEIIPGVIADRRHLHQHPELGFQEHATSAFVADRLRSLGVDEVRTGVGRTGVVGILRGTKPVDGPSRTVLCRADMDALPIEEENDVEYRSLTRGCMHACGHDAHVAMLLGTARTLNDRRDEFAGTVVLLFQPAEEGLGGANAMIADGVLDDPRPDGIFGLHIWQHADLGTVEARVGTAMVGAVGFTITVRGVGGHGAQPHTCIDPITVGAQIVTALQTLISREKDPVLPGVVTVGVLRTGDAANVIPETATIQGTIRTVTRAQRETLVARVTEVAKGIASSLRATATVEIPDGCPPLINDPRMTAIVRAAAAEVVGLEGSVEGPLKVVSEDMSEFLDRVPGCFFFVGSRNPERGLVWGHHHPRFEVDEDALAIGIGTTVRSVLAFLNGA